MKKIKYVKTMDENGCGVSCIAMVAGLSYFQMREKLSEFSPRHGEMLIHLTQLQLHAYESYNILRTYLGVRCRGARFVPLMKNHCILYILHTNVEVVQQAGHAIVWDAKQQKFLDPDGPLESLDGFNVYQCIEILPPKAGLEVEELSSSKYWRFNGVGPRVRLTKDNQLEYVHSDLLFTDSDMLPHNKEKRIARIQKAIGLSKFKIKKELLKVRGRK